MRHPLPPFLDRLPLGHEVDKILSMKYEVSLVWPKDSLEQFYWERGHAILLKSKPVLNNEDCWIICRHDGKPIPNARVLRRMKWILSAHIGTELAAFYNFIPQHYDSEFHETYRFSVTVGCKFNQNHCVRPSHLIPVTYLGHPLRP